MCVCMYYTYIYIYTYTHIHIYTYRYTYVWPPEVNFQEALDNAYKAWIPYEIPESVQKALLSYDFFGAPLYLGPPSLQAHMSLFSII